MNSESMTTTPTDNDTILTETDPYDTDDYIEGNPDCNHRWLFVNNFGILYATCINESCSARRPCTWSKENGYEVVDAAEEEVACLT